MFYVTPPTEQLIIVNLPAGVSSSSSLNAKFAESLADVFGQPTTTLGQDSINDKPALPADKAFVYEAIGLSGDTILVRFTIQPGYYLVP